MIAAHLVCAALAGGGAECAVVVDADRAAVWQRVIDGKVTVTSALPFGATSAVEHTLAPESPDGRRYVADRAFAAGDFLPCAVTVVRAELDGVDGAIWRGTATLRSRCAHPRVRARAACDRAWETSSDDWPPRGEDARPVIVCRAVVAGAAVGPLVLHARRGDVVVGSDETADAEVIAVLPDPGGCVPRVQLALTTHDGAIVWRGRARVDAACPLLR